MFIGYIFDKINNRSGVDVAEVDIILDRAVKPPSIESIKDSVISGFRGMFWGFFLGLTLLDSMSAIFNGSAVLYVPVIFAISGLVLSIVLRRQKDGD